MKRLVALSLLSLVAFGTSAPQAELSDAVRAFVRIDTPAVALVGVKLIDGTGALALAGQTVLLRDGGIEWVGASAMAQIPADAEVLELDGYTVMPGLVMVHEHMFYPSGQGTYNQMQYSFPRLYLAAGATTIRTGGSRDPYGDLNLKVAIDAGRLPGPNIDVTGPYVNGPGLPIMFVNAVDGPDEAVALVNYWADEGATSFKAYMQITRAELGAALEVIHGRGLRMTGHLCSVTYAEAAELGIDNVEHGFMAATDFVADKRPDVCPSGRERTESMLAADIEGPEVQALFRTLIDHGVAVTSTLPVFEISTPGRPPAPDGALDAMSPDARDRYLRQWARVAQQNSSQALAAFDKNMAMEKAFADAGGLLVAGTDPTGYGGVVAGYANQREIELLAEAGFTPEQAVSIATLNGARYLGIDGRTGTVEVGKAADLMVVRGDPASDIGDIRNVEIVFKDGVGFDSQALFDSVKGTVGIR
ncbi:MAG: amidohydrolase family protein [Acidobacteriota bacterium]